jgi:hypothetical protein
MLGVVIKSLTKRYGDLAAVEAVSLLGPWSSSRRSCCSTSL